MNLELGRWLALRRVHGGGIAQFAHGGFVDRGRPVPDYIGGSLATLLALTSAGEIRYADLTDSYQQQRRVR